MILHAKMRASRHFSASPRELSTCLWSLRPPPPSPPSLSLRGIVCLCFFLFSCVRELNFWDTLSQKECASLSQFHTLADTLELPMSVPPVYIEGIRRFLTTHKHTHFLQSGQPICTGRALSQSYEGIQILDPPRQIQGLQA